MISKGTFLLPSYLSPAFIATKKSRCCSKAANDQLIMNLERQGMQSSEAWNKRRARCRLWTAHTNFFQGSVAIITNKINRWLTSQLIINWSFLLSTEEVGSLEGQGAPSQSSRHEMFIGHDCTRRAPSCVRAARDVFQCPCLPVKFKSII